MLQNGFIVKMALESGFVVFLFHHDQFSLSNPISIKMRNFSIYKQSCDAIENKCRENKVVSF